MYIAAILVLANSGDCGVAALLNLALPHRASTMYTTAPVERAGALLRAAFTSASAEELCRICNLDIPNATALAYAVSLCAAAFVAWAVSVLPIVDTFESWMPAHLLTHCEPGLPCFRIMAVHRIMGIVMLYHAILLAATFGSTMHSFRGTIHNGWWGIKTLALVLTISAMFHSPIVNALVSSSLEYHEVMFASLFGELIEYAESLAEASIDRYGRENPATEQALILGFTSVPYCFAGVFLIFLFGNVVQPGCYWELGYLTTTGVLFVCSALFYGVAVGRCVKPKRYLIRLGFSVACGVLIVGYKVLMCSDNCSPYATMALPSPWLTMSGMTIFIAVIASSVANHSSAPPNGYELLDQEGGTKRHTCDTRHDSFLYHYKFLGAAAFVAMFLTNWCVLANRQRSTRWF